MGFIINNLTPLLYLEEINLVSGSYAAIFTQLVPIFSVLLFYAFKVEDISSLWGRRSLFQLLGVVVGCSFAISIVGIQFKNSDQNKFSNKLTFGTVLAILHNLLFSFQYVCQWKLFFSNPDSIFKARPLTSQACAVNAGFFVYCIMFGPYLCVNYQNVFHFSVKTLIPILYSSVIVCPISLGLLAFCNKHTSPIFVGASWPLRVVFSLLFIKAFSNEGLDFRQFILFHGAFFGFILVVLSPMVESTSEEDSS